MHNDSVIVSGGAGFIGSHITERLLAEGFRVKIIDNFSTGKQENLKHLRSKKLSIHKFDIADFDNIRHLFKQVKYVFHIAGLADIVPSIERPLEYHGANVDGTISMLEAARHAGVKKFVYAASSSCYGIPDQYPTDECSQARPEYPYALTKYVGEQYVMHWHKVYKLPVISLRLFNVYGPRSRTSGTYGAVFGVFLAQKLANKKFTIVGDGRQKRDFIYVSDVAEAFTAAAESKETGKIYNVGSGKPVSVNQLADLLGGERTYIPKRPGEPDITYADISKIRKELKWKPTISFTEGVSRMLDNIGCWKNAPVWTPDTIRESTKTWFKYLGKKGI